ncbi:hypothetical protein Tco_0817168 [Tanacetum coccineum]
MDFEQMFSQKYYPIQDYSMGHGSAHGSGHGSAPVDDDEEDDSPVEEAPPKYWTVEEEIALCQAWCDVSKNSERGNSMKTKGFWEAVINYFVKESGSTRGRQILKHQKEEWERGRGKLRSYIELKIRELEIQEAERRKAAELNREKLAIQRRM